LKGCWVPHDTRDQIVDYVGYWTERTEIPACRLLGWMELGTSKFHDWKQRYGKVNEHILCPAQKQTFPGKSNFGKLAIVR
jgi:hypothetical protein